MRQDKVQCLEFILSSVFFLHQQVAWLNRSSPLECTVLALLLITDCPYWHHNFRLFLLNISCLPIRHLSKGSEDENPCGACEVTSAGKVPLCSCLKGMVSSQIWWVNWMERFFQNHRVKILRGGKKDISKVKSALSFSLILKLAAGCTHSL